MNKGNILLAIGFGLVAILNSCKDDTGTLGPNVLPKSDLISAYEVDTDRVVTSMFLKDSATTLTVGDILLGSYNDPVFGESKASFYASVSPCTTYTAAPWDAGQVDSAVLLINLAPGALYYGGSDPQVFEVYQTDDTLSITNNYSSMSIPHSILMGSQLVTLPATNSINDTLKIKLSYNWLINHFAINLENGNNWTTTFQNVIKGIYVTTATPLQLPGQGSLINVATMGNSTSNICVYYHTSPGSELTAPFYLGSPYYFVHFDHNYATTAFGMHPMGIRDSVAAGQLMYVQAMGGVMGRLNFPNLYKNWSKMGPVVINEAVVNIPYEPISSKSLNYTSGPPNYLYLIQTDSIGGQLAINNAPLASSTPVNNSYSFVITQYIQGIIDDKTVDRGLFVLPDEQETANGVVMYGAQHGVAKSGKTTLTIYYTPLKNN